MAFRLECDERVVLDLPAGEIVSTRVRTLFGKDLAQSLIAVSGNAEGMELIGFVAHPREAKPTAKRQYVFLNGRFVRDKLLLAAVREGARRPEGRPGACPPPPLRCRRHPLAGARPRVGPPGPAPGPFRHEMSRKKGPLK